MDACKLACAYQAVCSSTACTSSLALVCYFATVLTISCMPISLSCLASSVQHPLKIQSWFLPLRCCLTHCDDDLKNGVDVQVAIGNDGQPVDLKSLLRVPLTDRMQCDCCAACITDVHRTCTKCGDYDACIRCCRAVRTEDKVMQPYKPMFCDLLVVMLCKFAGFNRLAQSSAATALSPSAFVGWAANLHGRYVLRSSCKWTALMQHPLFVRCMST